MLTANFQGDGGHINGEIDFEIDIATNIKEPQMTLDLLLYIYCNTKSLVALWAPTFSWGPFGPA